VPVPDLQLDREALEWVAVAAAAVAALSLLLVLFTLARLRAVNRRVRRLTAPGTHAGTGGADLRAMRHVAVVRYDAFADMGGRLSFSAALFDAQGDGLVLSSINGRSETRTYAKALRAYESEHTLSPEEHQAIAEAREEHV
jgi:Protein of unknown function (DUF4446)